MILFLWLYPLPFNFFPFFQLPIYFVRISVGNNLFAHLTNNDSPKGEITIPRPFGTPFSTSPSYFVWILLSPKYFHTLPEEVFHS